MKQDKLEQYISQHRTAFDTESAPPLLWAKISTELDESRSKSRSLLRVISVAAGAAVILCAGLLIGLQLGQQDPMTASPKLREFAEAENFYANQFNVKWSEYRSLEPESNSVANDLEQLDVVYQELRAELEQNPELNTEKVIDALLENYITKINILETVLEKTKSKNLSNLKLHGDELEKI